MAPLAPPGYAYALVGSFLLKKVFIEDEPALTETEDLCLLVVS